MVRPKHRRVGHTLTAEPDKNAELVEHARKCVEVAPRVVGAFFGLGVLLLIWPLAPVRHLLVSAGLGVFGFFLGLVGWRLRSQLLLLSLTVIVPLVGTRLTRGAPDLPFVTHMQEICVFGITLFGPLWLLRPFSLRFARLESSLSEALSEQR